MPVCLLGIPDCLCSSYADTPSAGDKGVGELLQCPHFSWLQRLAVLQFAVALLQHTIVDSFYLDLIEIQP